MSKINSVETMPKIATNKDTFRILIIALAIIISLGFLIRIINLGTASLWIDEGYSINAALQTLEHGYPLLDSGEIYKSSPLHTYVVAVFIKLFGLNAHEPWVPRLPSVLFGTALIPILYFFVIKLFDNRWMAIAVAIVMALSFWEIEWSREARGYIMMQFFFFLSLLYFFEWLESRKFKSLALTTISSIAAWASHGLGLTILPVYFISTITVFILEKEKQLTRRGFQSLLIMLLTAGVFIALIYFFVISKLTLYNYTHIYTGYLFSYLPLFTWGSILGMILALHDKKRFKAVALVTIALLFAFMLVIKFWYLVQMRYLFPFFPLMIVLTCYAVFRVVEIIGNLVSLFFKKITSREKFIGFLPALATGIFITLTLPYLVFVPQKTYHLEPDSPRPNFKEAYEVIAPLKSAESIIISPYAHLTELYLDTKGLWLPISLTGKRSLLEGYIATGRDKYSGAPLIRDAEHLQTVLDESHGFIVIDKMAEIRLGNLNNIILEHSAVEQLYFSGNKKLDKIWVYRF